MMPSQSICVCDITRRIRANKDTTLLKNCLQGILPEIDCVRWYIFIVSLNLNCCVEDSNLPDQVVVTTIPAVLTPATGGFDPVHVCILLKVGDHLRLSRDQQQTSAFSQAKIFVKSSNQEYRFWTMKQSRP